MSLRWGTKTGESMWPRRVAAVVAVVAALALPGSGAHSDGPVAPARIGLAGPGECDRTPVDHGLKSPYLDAAGEAVAAAAVDAATGALDGVRRRSEPPGVPYTYLLYVPDGLPEAPVPLMVAMHGLGGHGPQFANQSQWARFARDRGFIVAFPSGTRRWDATEGSVDVTFIRDVVAEIRQDRCIDARRIWATGHSYGGFMTQRLACDAGDVFAAGAVVSGGNITAPGVGGPCRAGAGTNPAAGYEPVPLAFWHGTDDPIVAYAQGRKSLDGWVARYGCSPIDPGAPVAYGTTETYGECTRADIAARDDPPGSDTAEQVRPPGFDPAGRPFRPPFVVRFRTYDAHGHGYPEGCGGLGQASTQSCDEPDPDAWPTTDSHAQEILSFLFDQQRISPAPASPAPAPAPIPALSDPADIGPWLVGVVESNRR